MATLKGLFNEVRPQAGRDPTSNLNAFFLGLLGGQFDATTFGPMAGIRVHLGIRPSPLIPLPTSFVPQLSLEAETRSDGRFEIEVPDPLMQIPGGQGFLVGFRNAIVRSVEPQPIELLAPVYRSGLFPLSAIGSARAQMFVARIHSSDHDALTAAEINAIITDELPALQADNPDLDKLKEIRASIRPNGLHFFVAAAANTRAEFDLALTPGTGPVAADLAHDALLQAKIANVAIEGGNVFGRICASRAKLEAAISRSAAAFAGGFRNAILQRIEERAAAVNGLLESCGAFTVEAIRFPLVDRVVVIPGHPLTVHLQALAVDLAIDYPRLPFAGSAACAAPAPTD